MSIDRSDLPVRLVVLNHDGGDLTLRCLEHIRALDWPQDRLEIVCIDNASTDGSPDAIAERCPDVRLVRLPSNGGFGANNLGLVDLEGIRFVGLVNNDAFVEPGWLSALVTALDADVGLGAVSPKIVLEPRFCGVRITVDATTPGGGDHRVVGARLRGVIVDDLDQFSASRFSGSGWGREVDRRGPFEWSGPIAELCVPAPSETGAFAVRITLDAPAPAVARLDGGLEPVDVPIGPTPTEVVLAVDGERFDVLNGVGSAVLDDGHGVDRGWLEIDRGQWDTPADVFAWSGGGVLFRPEFLDDVGRFEERFFLYYEDTDLSWRGRARGWRYRTVPEARMRHVHSASTGTVSALTLHLTERNRLIMLARNARLSTGVQQVIRFLLVTASYARRDILGRVRIGRRPDPTIVDRRLRSFVAFLGSLGWIAATRRTLRRRRLVDDRLVEMDLIHRG